MRTNNLIICLTTNQPASTMIAPPNPPAPREPQNLPEILKFLAIPYSFQIEKILRKVYTPQTAYLLDGINDIPQSGFAVALERRFNYALNNQLGTSNPGYNYLNASFLDTIGAFSDDADGVKIYFGLDTLQNRLVPILTQVEVLDFNPATTVDNAPYYLPTDANDGDWVELPTSQFQVLRDNYKAAVAQINQVIEIGGGEKYKIQGYFIGKDAIQNVLSEAPANQFSTTVVREGIKLYFGIQEDLVFYDYEKGNLKQVGGGLSTVSMSRDLHLILVGVDSPTLGPLASFDRIFATIETDARAITNGVSTDLLIDSQVKRLINGQGSPCIYEDRTS